DRIHPEDVSRYCSATAAHLRGDTALLECEYRVRGADGRYRWVLDRSTAVREASGRAIRIVGAIQDVSDRKAAEAALRQSEEALRHKVLELEEAQRSKD